MHHIHLKKWLLRALLLFLLLLICFGFYNPLTLVRYEVSSSDLPAGLDGYRIIQISDLHSTQFGQQQNTLIQMIREAQPDLILLTGDIMDKHDTDLEQVQMLLEGITQLAPVYAVAGNHEYTNYSLYVELKALYERYHVAELEDTGQLLLHNGERIYLYGIGALHTEDLEKGLPLSIPDPPEDCYGILLYHFSMDFEAIAAAQSGYSLLFTGHSHGGIIRLPLLGPLISNDGTLFPKYAGGLYEQNGLTMVASRGMGKSFIPRFNNPMELVCVTLTAG